MEERKGNLMPDLSPVEINDRTQLSPVSVPRYKLISMIRETEPMKMGMLESPPVMKRRQNNS